MVEEKTLVGVERFDGGDFVRSKREAEDVEVFAHPVSVRCFGNDDDALLKEKSQRDLRDGLVVSFADLRENRVREEAVLSLGKRSPRHQAAVQFVQERTESLSLLEYVRLHLVYHRGDFVVDSKIHDVVGEEVAHADSAAFAGFIGFFKGAPGAVAVAEGLVQEHQIYVVRINAAKRLVESFGRPDVAVVGNPDLGDEEDLLTLQTAFGDARANAFLVLVDLCGIDHSVASAESFYNALFRLNG